MDIDAKTLRALKKLASRTVNGKLKGVLTGLEMEMIFSTTSETIRKLINDEGLPSFRIGKNNFYIEKHVLKWAEERSTRSRR